MSDSYNKKVNNATKWSAVAEILSKIITPVSSMILARLLTPEAFGIVATVSMVISFSNIFSDAGFQRYLIYNEFRNELDLKKSTNVAFLTNLIMSIIIWFFIIFYRSEIAILVGNPGLGDVLAIACVGIPLSAFSSIQIALFKRSLNFKTLFKARIATIIIPLVVTIPLAFSFKNYWALIIGSILQQLATVIILTIKSNWKPNLYYSFVRLKEMFSYCIWVLIDAILVWITNYLDIFLIGIYLSAYYLGLYKTSMTIVGQILTIITSIVVPVMLPALSRLQNDISAMKEMLLKFQKYTGILLIPLGVGIFIFRDLITKITLGDQWSEAVNFIGIWGFMSVVTIIFSRFSSIIYPAIGKPKYSVYAQILHLIVLIPAIYISVQYGYEALYYTRSFVRIELVLVNLYFAYQLIKFSPWKMMKNLYPEFISSIFMSIIAYVLLRFSDSLVWQFFTIFVCIISYIGMLYMFFSKERAILLTMKNSIEIKFRAKIKNENNNSR